MSRSRTPFWNAYLALALCVGCTSPVPVSIDLLLPSDAGVLRDSLTSVSLNAYSEADARLLGSTSIDFAKLATAKPQLPLKVGERVRLIVRGLRADGQVMGAGEARFTVVKQQAAPLAIFVGPVADNSRFVPHPRLMKVPRDRAGVITDSAGLVWFFGGSVRAAGTTAATKQIEVYDPATLEFTLIDAQLQVPTIEPMVGRVYVAGKELIVIAGGESSAGDVLNDAQVFDPVERKLGSPQILATGHRTLGAVFEPKDNRLILIGGLRANRTDMWLDGTTILVDAGLNLVTDTRVASGQTPMRLTTGRVRATVVEAKGEWYLVGGELRASVAKFTPSTGAIDVLATSSLSRLAPPCATLVGSVFIFACGENATLERFTLGGDMIEIVAQEKTARAEGVGVRLPNGDLLLTGGGDNAVYRFGASTIDTTPFSTFRAGHSLVWTATRTLLAIGGNTGPNPSVEILAFDGP